MAKNLSEVKEKLNNKIDELNVNAQNISEIKNDDATKSEYETFVSSLNSLMLMTNLQYEKDQFGLDKRFDEKKLLDFKLAYAKSGKAGETLLKNMKKYKGTPAYETILSIQKIISDDFKTLNGVDPESLKGGTVSLQKIMKDVKTKTVDISGKNLGTVGGNMSKRIPFNYVEMDGKENPGVFTPKKIFDIHAEYNAIIDEIRKNAPYAAKFYESLEPGIYDYFKKVPQAAGFSNEALLIYGLGNLCPNKSLKLTQDSMEEGLRLMFKGKDKEFHDSLKTPDGQIAWKIYRTKMGYFRNSAGLNLNVAKIADKSRIDSRNSAMSAVADVLGVPNLICKAMPLKVVDNGVETEGTFMSLADGVDLHNPTIESQFYNLDDTFNHSNGFKDVADLQIVDFICGNIDRHSGNMFYKFDTSSPSTQKHKFIGVQGIDNDCSFGTYLPTDSDKNNLQFCALNNLKYISESMAKRITVLKPEMLALTLRNSGLGEEQISSACVRLNFLKGYINKSLGVYSTMRTKHDKKAFDIHHVAKNTIRILFDDEFKNLDVDKMISICENNYFTKILDFPEAVADYVASNKKFEPQKIEETKAFKMDDAELAKVKKWSDELSARTSIGRSSDEYRAMQESVSKYYEFCKFNKDKIMSEDLLNVRKSYLDKICDSTSKYLIKKVDVENPSNYTQKRIDYANELFANALDERNKNYYDDIKNSMSPEDYKRYADGMHARADQELEDFNAKMREMALEIQRKAENIKVKEDKVQYKDIKDIDIKNPDVEDYFLFQ